MIIFKKKNQNLYLITNYKVMYSTFNCQETLTAFWPTKRWLLNLLYYKFYFISRNPYDRIASFYKNKFLQAEQSRKWLEANKMGSYEKCVSHFFPYIDIDPLQDSKEISHKLMEVEFQDFISVLPEVYMMDRHMTPQYLAKKIKLKIFGFNFSIPLKFKSCLKMENSQDLTDLKNIFELDLSINVNSTKSLEDKVLWDEKSYSIIKTLYSQDFKQFGYNY